MSNRKSPRPSGNKTPFFYQSAWYVAISGQRKYLLAGTPEEKAEYARQKAKAKGRVKTSLPIPETVWQVYHSQMSVQTVADNRGATPIATLVQAFLNAKKDAIANGEMDERTYSEYDRRLALFIAARSNKGKTFGELAIQDLTPAMINAFLAGQEWGSGYKRSVTKLVKQLFNWSIGEGLLAVSPIAKLKLGQEATRDTLIEADQQTAILARAPKQFADIFTALLETGRRPEEICLAKVENVQETAEGLILILREHKNVKKSGKPEYVYATPKLAEIVRRLTAGRSTGFIFQTVRKQRWTPAKLAVALKTIRKNAKLPDEITPYCTRHTYITSALIAGVPLALVAEIVGNSPVVLAKHYAHLDKARQINRFALANQATGSCGDCR